LAQGKSSRRLSFGLAAPQQVLGAKPVNFDFLVNFPEAKRIPLLSILTPTDFDQRLTFRDRISNPLAHISLLRQIAALIDQRYLQPLPRWAWLEAIDHRSAFDDPAGALLLGL
jgi:hypothetical protein